MILIDRIIKLHRDGLTYGQMEQMLGINRNAVAGRCGRLIRKGILDPRPRKGGWNAETHHRRKAQGEGNGSR